MEREAYRRWIREEKHAYRCRCEGKEQCPSIHQEYLESIVLEHVPPSVDLNDLGVFPREHGGLLIRGQHLGDVGITKRLITDKVTTQVS